MARGIDEVLNEFLEGLAIKLDWDEEAAFTKPRGAEL
jgi:hypothetical protein